MKKLYLALVLATALPTLPAHAAISHIDFGAAKGYSAFFFGNASKVMDVEGKFAVGGNLDTTGFSFGYRTPYGDNGPSLVVGGDVKLGSGVIYKGPNSNINTNDSIGPITSWEKPVGYGVYGGNKQAAAYHDLRQGQVIDFAAAKTQLSGLSSQLAAEAANGKVEAKWSSLYLTGDNQSKVQVFNVNSNQIGNVILQNVAEGAQVVVNVFGGNGKVVFSGGQDGQLQSLRDRVLFNVVNASEVNISTFTWGSILATHANITGSGHIEGSVIANSISAQVEIGYEPWHNPSPVPEAQTWAMLFAGLGLTAFFARRRRA